MTMALTPTQSRILELAVEDFYGLCELLAWIRDILRNASNDELISTITSDISVLTGKGLIGVYRREWPDGQPFKIAPEELKAFLENPIYWEPDSAAKDVIEITSTPLGEDIYYQTPSSE